MIDIMLILWIIIFFIMIVIHLHQGSTNFGAIAGFWLLLMGAFIITTGIQIQSGWTTSVVDGSQITELTYTNATLPYSTYSYIWGVPLVLVGIYIVFANLLAKTQ